MKKPDMIVDRPELKSEWRKVAEGSLTFILWLLWSYCILPIVNLILWLLGIRLFYLEVLSRQAYLYFLEFLQKGALIISITTLFILVWILYNFVLFRSRGDRRKRIKVVRDHDMAARFKVNPKTLRMLKQSTYVKCTVDDASEARFSVKHS